MWINNVWCACSLHTFYRVRKAEKMKKLYEITYLSNLTEENIRNWQFIEGVSKYVGKIRDEEIEKRIAGMCICP